MVRQELRPSFVFRGFEIVDKIPSIADKRYIGVDFGFTNDPTAICEVAVYGDILYIDEICYRTEMLSTEIIQVLKTEAPRMKVISESADPRLIQEIYRAGIDIHPVKKFAGSIEAGLAKMQEYKIVVTKRSVNVMKELKNYTYRQDKEGKWLNAPIDCYNHAIDAVRYVIMEEVMGGKRRLIDVNRLKRLI